MLVDDVDDCERFVFCRSLRATKNIQEVLGICISWVVCVSASRIPPRIRAILGAVVCVFCRVRSHQLEGHFSFF